MGSARGRGIVRLALTERVGGPVRIGRAAVGRPAPVRCVDRARRLGRPVPVPVDRAIGVGHPVALGPGGHADAGTAHPAAFTTADADPGANPDPDGPTGRHADTDASTLVEGSCRAGTNGAARISGASQAIRHMIAAADPGEEAG